MSGYTRHQLKQDQFSTAARETVHWAVAHRQKIVWLGIAAAVLLASALGAWAYGNHRETQASEVFGHAMLIYNAPLSTPEQPAPVQPSFATAAERSKAAHAEFAKIAGEYSRARTGKLARYFSGVTALDMGDTAGAERDLKQVIDSADADITALARLALANLCRNSNRAADAVKLYNQLIDKPARTVSKQTAQLELASLFAASNQPDQARKLYQQIKQENPQNAAGQIADMRLQAIK